MSVVAITGDHPRHSYFVQCLAQTGKLTGWVRESREAFVPQPPNDISPHLQQLFKRHFELRENVENNFFALDNSVNDLPRLDISVDELNSNKTIQYIQSSSPALVLSYGCHKLSANLIQQVNAVFWNTHGGLSPEYRGVTTHFWPSYFLEPQMTGMTLHETTDELDGGAVIMQTSAPMVKGDGLHQLAARNVSHYSHILQSKIQSIDLDALPAGTVQKSYGRVFMVHDWRPEHLPLIYDTYEDSIVDRVIDGTIGGREPVLTCVI